MKATEWASVSKPLAALLPGFRRIKFGFVREHPLVAECLYADGSDFNRHAFYLQSFALPLFIPTQHLYFSYGSRIGSLWEGVSDTLIDAVLDSLPTLAKTSTLEGIAALAAFPQRNIHHAEVRLCIAVLTNDDAEFMRSVAILQDWTPTRPWEMEVQARCMEVVRMVDVAGRESAVALITDRRDSVLSVLS